MEDTQIQEDVSVSMIQLSCPECGNIVISCLTVSAHTGVSYG